MKLAHIAATGRYEASSYCSYMLVLSYLILQLQVGIKLAHIAATGWSEATTYCSYK